MATTTVMKSADPATASSSDRLRVGTLRYTMAGLVWLLIWLLWGDFCYTVMEYVNLQIIPLRLDELKAGDYAIPMILGTIPSTINFILNPILSTMSDRCRTRFGRRRPFLMLSAPLVSISLVFMAFSKEIGEWFFSYASHWGNWTNSAAIVFVIGVLYGTFKAFDLLVNTSFWYLFNDVVPHAYMNRFMGLFRMVGSGAAFLFNFYFLEHSLSHLREIYLGAAAIYFVGFSLMVLMIKEGEYPPPAPITGQSKGFFNRIYTSAGTYFRECLTHRIYWYFFAYGVFATLANASGVFGVGLQRSLQLDLKQLATLGWWIQLVQFLLSFPAGWLADRYHPLRLTIVMQLCLLCTVPLQFVWLFGNFTSQEAFHITLGLTAADMPIGLIMGGLWLPLMMHLLPRSRFGQFCSFNALCAAITGIIGSLLVAPFMSAMRHFFPDAVWGVNYCYRLIPAWRIPFMCLSILCLYMVYREWKRMGGAEGRYVAPEPELEQSDPRGFPVEAVPQVELAAAESDPNH